MSEYLQGYEELRARIARISGPNLGRAIMGPLAAAAVREQKLLLYQNVTRRTGHSGQLVTLGAVTDTTALTRASGTAVYIDRGTKAHDIYPRFKKALAFASQGLLVQRLGVGQWQGGKKGRFVENTLTFRKTGSLTTASQKKFGNAALAVVRHVRHPGTVAHPFMLQGAQKAIAGSGLAERIVAAWNGRTA